MLTLIPTKNMPQEQWLAHRRNAIGGSDAAAIIGLNSYSTPFAVWMDKLGKAEPVPENEAMRLGHDLEEYVARRFTEATGKKVRRKNAIIYNDEYPFAHANIDREIIGESAILECKTTSRLNMQKFKNGEYPQNYYVQVMHYMAVTGAQKAYIAVLVLQEGFYWFEVNRDEAEIKALMDAERRFWSFVVSKTEPPAIAEDADAIFDAHPQSNGQKVDLFGKASKMKRLIEVKADIKTLTDEKETLETDLKQALGDNESGEDDGYLVSWKSQKPRLTFQPEDFKAKHPDIDLAPFYKSSPVRKFAVKKIS